MEITLSTVTFEDWKAVIKKAVEQAKRGDEKARKFLADFLIGVPKQKHEISGPEDSALTIKFIWDDNQDNKNAEAA